MIPVKVYLWVMPILAGLMLCGSGIQAWLYFHGRGDVSGWIVLAQFIQPVFISAMIPLTCRRTKRRVEQLNQHPYRPWGLG